MGVFLCPFWGAVRSNSSVCSVLPSCMQVRMMQMCLVAPLSRQRVHVLYSSTAMSC